MSDNRRFFFRILDMGCIVLALGLSSWLMLPPFLHIFSDYTGASTFTLVTFFLSFYMLDCYSVGAEDFKDSVIRVIMAVVIGIIGTGFIFYTFEHWRFPRLMFVLQMIVILTLTLGWRFLYFHFSRHFSAKPERIIFLGSTMAVRARHVLGKYMYGCQILGYTGSQEEALANDAGTWLGEAKDTLQIIRQHNATRLLILNAGYLDSDLARVLFAAKVEGLPVNDMRSTYEELAQRLPVDLIKDEWLLLESGFNLNAQGSMWRIKRSFDVIFSLTLLIATFPILIITALLVRLESQGSIVYSQERVGMGMKEFTVYKIRSMYLDAEKNGAVWAAKKDPRVTHVGKFIRKTRIDELPQLINVLKGDMSIVGPRPERMGFVKELEQQLPYYNVRHAVKPGITGWAQVCYPYGASIEDARYKLEYDLFYVKNMSLLLETKIILKTIGVILFPKGAR